MTLPWYKLYICTLNTLLYIAFANIKLLANHIDSGQQLFSSSLL